MPMPLSEMVRVLAVLSTPTFIFRSGLGLEQAGVVQGLEAQLVAGVGGVGNQLAQEDLAVAVEGVDHQLKQLLHFGLEAEGLLAGRRVHAFLHKKPLLYWANARYFKRPTIYILDPPRYLQLQEMESA
jgi:hypothetical protein